jgi:hypothetical protein
MIRHLKPIGLVLCGAFFNQLAFGQSADMLGKEFPLLIEDIPSDAANPEKRVPPCKQVRAKKVSELEPPWQQAVQSLNMKCKAKKVMSDEPTAVTDVVAKLKPGAIKFAGLAVSAVRDYQSEGGHSKEYVIDAPFSSIKKQLIAALESKCQREHSTLSAESAKACRLGFNASNGGASRDTGQGGAIWVHANPKNRQQTIYEESFAQ